MKDGKKNKVSYSPKTGTSAKINEPTTFHSFSDAKQAASDYNEIGLRVSRSICGIDVDDFIDEAGKLSDFVKEVIRYFPNWYIEKSPSGSGLHIYFKVPDFQYDTDTYYVNNQNSGLEIYVTGTTKRFLTLTGDVFQDGILEDMTDILPQFSERYMKHPSQSLKMQLNL